MAGSADLARGRLHRLRSHAAVAATGAVALALVAAGCGQTTQDQNLRLGLRAKRTVESRTPVEVKRVNPDVEVVSATLLRGEGESAIAVNLRNTGGDIVHDLPIEVGVGDAVLNSSAKTPYFQGRAPVIGPGEEATFVYTTKSDPGDGAAFARVGTVEDPLTEAPTVPELSVSHELVGSKKGASELDVEVENANDFPQYDLEVYAWAEKDGRIVAAGRGAIEHIGSNGSADVEFSLVGDPQGAEIQVQAPATFFE